MRLTAEWTRLEWHRKWRSLLVLALLVAVSAATVLTAFAGARRDYTAFDRLWARTLPATVTVLPNQPGFDWAKIRKLPEVAALTTFAVSSFMIDGYPLAGQETGFPPGDSQVWHTIERPVVLDGRVLNPRQADEVDVSAFFPAGYGKSVGDTLTIQLPTAQQAANGWDSSSGPARGPKLTVRIVGVLRSPWFSDTPGTLGAVLPSPALLTRYPDNVLGPVVRGHHTGVLNAMVRLRGGDAAIARFRDDLAKVTHRSDIEVWSNLANTGDAVHRITGYEAACLLAFGLAALAAALFLVGQSVVRYTAASVSDLQLLRAPGITPREAAAAASAGPFLAALVGATLGVSGAIVASNWMPLGAGSLFEPEPGIRPDWAILTPGWLAIPLLVLGGSVTSAYAALAAGRAQRAQRRSVIAGAAVNAGAPVPVLVGARFALEPGRGASSLPVRPALVGAIAGVLGVLAAFTFSAGVTDAAANPARFGQTAQLEAYLGFNGQDFGPGASAAAAMRTIAGNHEVTGVNDARSAVAQAGQESITTYTYAPVGGKRMPVVLTAGRMPHRPGETVLAPTTARRLHATTGSSILLDASAERMRFRITGIGFVPQGPHNDYDSGAWVTAAGYSRLFAHAHYPFKFHVVQVALHPGDGVAGAARRLNAIVRSVKGAAAYHLGPANGTPTTIQAIKNVSALPFALGGFLVLLAVGAVGHALATAVRRRRHELAVLRALGLTKLQSRLVVTTQASLFAAIGLAFGVPLGVLLGRVTWRLVAQAAPLFYHPPLAVIALALAAPMALLTANLLAAWPGHRAASLASAQILRAE
jgi:hypothetical protein